MINDKLYQDLFLESHSKLAIKSLQTLSGFEEILIMKNKETNNITISKLELVSSSFNKYLPEELYFYTSPIPIYIQRKKGEAIGYLTLCFRITDTQWLNFCFDTYHIIYLDRVLTVKYYEINSSSTGTDFTEITFRVEIY